MGSLFWQLNDAWPAISWSAIDYYGCRKGAYFAAKESFKTTILSVAFDLNGLEAEVFLTTEVDLTGFIEVVQFDLNSSQEI